jgi:hypothetical protein
MSVDIGLRYFPGDPYLANPAGTLRLRGMGCRHGFIYRGLYRREYRL